jgi:putative aldouronate transport system substrate-binding protein
MFKQKKGPDNDRWWVPLPVVMEGYTEEFEGPPGPQVSEGVGISVNCKDPVGAIKYLDFLTSEEAVRTREWGFEGTDYSVDKDGYFVRNREQIDRWLDDKWKAKTFGQNYWIEMCGWEHCSLYPDGKNSVDPRYQPSIFFQNLYDTEKEVLKAYGKETWFDFFNKPDMKRTLYFPAWTIKMPSGSDIQIAAEKIQDIRRKYTPRLIMAKAGEYDKIWKEYLAALDKVKFRKEHEEFWQKEIDKRVTLAGGYKSIMNVASQK